MSTETPRPHYRAMHMLTEMYPPKIKGRLPYWRPKAPAVAGDVHLPVWNWERPRYGGDPYAPEDLVTMDVCGAFLAACSSSVFAHGALEATGAGIPIKAPGLYLVDAHPWQEAQMPSPLGTARLDDARVWVAHPTAALLDQLSTDGYWPQVAVHDSYTASTSCRLRPWTTAVKADRDVALRRRAAVRADITRALVDSGTAAEFQDELAEAEADYQAIKDGYSIAVQLMRGAAEGAKVKSPVYRPDWYATVHAGHAANTWRKAWHTTLVGHGPVALGAVDEVTWTAADLAELQMRPVSVLRIDPTGHDLGAFQVKEPQEG